MVDVSARMPLSLRYLLKMLGQQLRKMRIWPGQQFRTRTEFEYMPMMQSISFLAPKEIPLQ